MDIKTMSAEELEARAAAIVEEIDQDGTDVFALGTEVREIRAELESRKAAEAEKAEIRAQVAAGAGETIAEVKTEEREKKMDVNEIRNSAEYINAYAEYIKTGNDSEARALISTNASGTVPVPAFVYDVVKTAWEKEGIMSRVRKSYLKGNLKVGFEISASGATVHTEGAAAVSEETLTLGIVELVPASIKKWISISDEVYDLRGEEFLRYVYDELAYQIAKKASDTLVADIMAKGTASTTGAPAVPAITVATISLGTIAKAMAQLSDEAADPVIIMNKATWGEFKAVQAAGNYGYDPFEGLPVIFNNSVTAYTAATTGVTYCIVGDLGHGALANFPNGEEIGFKFDDLSLAAQDLVKITGRQFVGLGVVAPNAFAKITK